MALHAAADDGVGGLVDALLEALEARTALVVEGDQLAVEDRVAGAEPAREAAHLRVLGGDVVRLRLCSSSRPGRQ